MQSHIGCICLLFLHCVFSNKPPNYLLKRMQSYTGCILLTFLHCAFSNMSSNCLSKRMHSRIGCICFDFFCCMFSNESSNGLPQIFQTSPQIIYLRKGTFTLVAMTFLSTVEYYVYLQIACMKRSIVTLTAIVMLFFCCVFANQR